MNTQLSRLHNDVIQLDNYINTVRQRGDDQLLEKLNNKKNYLLSHIESWDMQKERCLVTQ